jgi:hypothetical protein
MGRPKRLIEPRIDDTDVDEFGSVDLRGGEFPAAKADFSGEIVIAPSPRSAAVWSTCLI